MLKGKSKKQKMVKEDKLEVLKVRAETNAETVESLKKKGKIVKEVMHPSLEAFLRRLGR